MNASSWPRRAGAVLRSYLSHQLRDLKTDFFAKSIPNVLVSTVDPPSLFFVMVHHHPGPTRGRFRTEQTSGVFI
jgi:hypothetical protein